MRIAQRLIAASILIALAGPLTGCGGGGLTGFDPSDLLDFLDTKKKLPGERKPVFPEGVPGLQQGVPKELYRGGVAEPAPELAPPAVEERKAKRHSKAPKARSQAAKRAPVAAAPADPDAAPAEEGSTAAAPPAPKGQKITRRRTTAPPTDATASAPAPVAAQPAPSAPSAFPAPLPSGGFSR